MADFIPYYERRGLDAQGVADEYWQREIQTLNIANKHLSPGARNNYLKMAYPEMLGRYENLKRFEAREVRQGKLNELDQRLAEKTNIIAQDIAGQGKAEEETYSKNISEANNAYDEFCHSINQQLTDGLIDQEEADRRVKYAEEQRALKLEAVKANQQDDFTNHYNQLLTQLSLSEPLIDNARAQNLFDESTAALAKQRAARTAVMNTVKALADNGLTDLADDFITRLEATTDKKSPLPSIFTQFGFTVDDIAALKHRNSQAKGIKLKQIEAAQKAQKQAIRDRFTKAETELYSNPVPVNEDEQEQYFSNMFIAYTRLSQQAESVGDYEESLKYSKLANGFQDKSISVGQKITFDQYSTIFDQGFYYDEANNLVEIDSRKMSDIAKMLFTNRAINRQHFSELMQKKENRFDTESSLLRDHVIELCKNISPTAFKYNTSSNRFAFKPIDKTSAGATTRTLDTALSSIEWSNGDDEEQLTYAQVIKCMNIANQWRAKNGKSVNEAIKYFDELTTGIIRTANMNTAAKAIEAAEAILTTPLPSSPLSMESNLGENFDDLGQTQNAIKNAFTK